MTTITMTAAQTAVWDGADDKARSILLAKMRVAMHIAAMHGQHDGHTAHVELHTADGVVVDAHSYALTSPTVAR
jgi:hypothetical protein